MVHWSSHRVKLFQALCFLNLNMEEVRSVLRDDVSRYNNQQVHSTTGEIPNFRFENARYEGNTLFHKFILPRPYTSPQDVFPGKDLRLPAPTRNGQWLSPYLALQP